MKNVVSVQWLQENMTGENIVIVDCRSSLVEGQDAYQDYLKSHIPRSYFIPMKNQLSGPSKIHGGRNPLPDALTFKRAMEDMGVNESTTVIAYDDNKLFTAARLWWQLKYIGHQRVYVLDGGFNKWIEEGYPATADIPKKQAGNVSIDKNKSLKITVEEIKHNLKQRDFILLDARTKERYIGEVESVDKIAGHIPGAKLYPAEENLNKKGEWKTTRGLKERFKEIQVYKDIALYCGSGINACMNFIALDELGLRPKLYVGSWSDWISYEAHPIAKGEK